MTLKDFLERQARWAYEEDPEMSLQAAIDDLTAEELCWRAAPDLWTIGEILYHLASAKIEYCRQGFGQWQGEVRRCVDELPVLLELLDRAQFHLLECLASCTEETLGHPVRTRYHGSSAAEFFGVMIAHDVAHAAQIRALRRRYGSRQGGFYPV